MDPCLDVQIEAAAWRDAIPACLQRVEVFGSSSRDDASKRTANGGPAQGWGLPAADPSCRSPGQAPSVDLASCAWP